MPSSALAQRTMRAPAAPSAAASAASSGRTTATTRGSAASRLRHAIAPMHSPAACAPARASRGSVRVGPLAETSVASSLSPPKRSPRPAASRIPTRPRGASRPTPESTRSAIAGTRGEFHVASYAEALGTDKPRAVTVFAMGQSDELRRGMARRPRPLEVVAAEPSGDVDDLADEVEPGNARRAHRLRRQLARVDAAPASPRPCCTRAFLPAVPSSGAAPLRWRRSGDRPVDASDPPRRAPRSTAWANRRGSRCASTLSSCAVDARWLAEPRRRVGTGQEIDGKRRLAVPVRRDLQDGRAREAAVREQQVLAKAAVVAGHLDVERDPGEIAVSRQRIGGESERHERGARRHDAQSELRRRPCSRTASRRSSEP